MNLAEFAHLWSLASVIHLGQHLEPLGVGQVQKNGPKAWQRGQKRLTFDLDPWMTPSHPVVHVHSTLLFHISLYVVDKIMKQLDVDVSPPAGLRWTNATDERYKEPEI